MYQLWREAKIVSANLFNVEVSPGMCIVSSVVISESSTFEAFVSSELIGSILEFVRKEAEGYDCLQVF